MWPFQKKKAEQPNRKVFISQGEGWRERVALQDEKGALWVRSIDDGWEVFLELVDGGEVRPASGNILHQYGAPRRWRDAPALALAKPPEPRP